ncbi:MAG: hypothetical protein D6778_07835, partial [Nitrospirae bacterium]
MKKALMVLLVVVFVVIVSNAYAQGPTIKAYPYLYKSPRAMGMGGAYVAIGGRTDSVFYNPAGLSAMPEDNWEVNLLGLSAEIGKNSIDFVNDLSDALDTGDLDGDGDEGDDQMRAVNDVLAQYRGENLHLGMQDLTSFGRNFGSMAIALGGVGTFRLDAMTHQGFGSNGLLEINGDLTAGGFLSLSARLMDGLYLGGTVKGLHREALVHSFTARELVEKQDNLSDYITDELRQSGDAVGFDLGLLYRMEDSSL